MGKIKVTTCDIEGTLCDRAYCIQRRKRLLHGNLQPE